MGLASRPRDDGGLDPHLSSNPREMTGDRWKSQKDRWNDLSFEVLEERIRDLEERMDRRFKSLGKTGSEA